MHLLPTACGKRSDPRAMLCLREFGRESVRTPETRKPPLKIVNRLLGDFARRIQ